MTRWRAVGLHVALVAVVYCICPVATSGDSRWMVPVSLNLIRNGSTTVEPPATEIGVGTERAPNGRLYASYPIAVAVISVPLLLPVEAARYVARPLFRSHISPTLKAFFAGDFAAARSLVEMLEASMLTALAAGVLLLICLEFVSLPLASFLTFVFAFATPAWSTASRAMWNHTPAMLMLSVAVYLLIRARRTASYAAYASIPLELAFMMRPTMAIAATALTVYVAIHHRTRLLRYFLLATPLAVLFFAYNLYTRDHLFQKYFTDAGEWPPFTLPQRFGLQLISPSRGLFVFCPIVAFSLWGVWLAWRRRWLFPLSPWLAALIFAEVLLIAKYPWPGYAYGPRYFTDILPLFILFLIPALQALSSAARGWKYLFVAALVWSLFIEVRGATTFAVHDWNRTPVDISLNTGRVWDWSDPQFLRGLH